MSKKPTISFWTKIRELSSWYFVFGLLISLTVLVFGLRHNNTVALKLKEDVVLADKQDKDIEGALFRLRTYVYGHMNTNLADGPNAIKPPIQLKYEYERLLAAQSAVAAKGQLPQQIPDSLYKFDFVSPIWSPDVAGWSMLLSIVFGLLLASRLILEYWLGQNIRRSQ